MMTSRVSPPPLSNRAFGFLALGVAAFTVYGSLVPLEFHYLPLSDALAAFFLAMKPPTGQLSRSDVLANVLLGFPLGFALLGAVLVDKRWTVSRVSIGLALLPICVAFAAVVEFSQLYVPVRTCALSDAIAQGVGSTAGMILWLLLGQRLTEWARPPLAGEAGGSTRLLVGYLAILVLIEMLPLDLNSSPADVYRKFRDGQVRLVPFADLTERSGALWWSRIETLIQLVGVYLPVGLLAGRVPRLLGRQVSIGFAIVGAMALSVGVECAQLVVRSRTTNATDAFVGSIAVVVGWAVVRGPSWQAGRRIPLAVGLGALWFATLGVASWQPFDLDWTLGSGRLTTLDWVPFLSLERTPALLALEAVLTKLVLFAPFGVLTAAVGCGRTLGARRVGLAALIGAVASVSLEVGQLFLPTRYPGLTDVLIGGAGAGVGAWIAGRCRANGERTKNC